jgi:hypothetical protein
MFCNPAAATGNADEHMYLFLKMKLVGGESLHISCHSFELEI